MTGRETDSIAGPARATPASSSGVTATGPVGGERTTPLPRGQAAGAAPEPGRDTRGVLAATAGVVVALVLGFWAATELVRGWAEVRRLEGSWATLEDGSAGPEDRVRGALGRMEALVVKFQLGDDATARVAFEREVREVTAWLAREGEAAGRSGPGHSESVAQVQRAWEAYLARLSGLLEKSARTLRKETAEAVFHQIESAAAPLEEACAAWGAVRRDGSRQASMQVRRAFTSLRRDGPRAGLVLLGAVVLGLGSVWGGHVRRLRRGQEHLAAGAIRHEELVSLGTFMAGVAHEIRNPLAAIKVRLFELKRKQTDGAAIGTVEVMEGEVRRLERMLDEVLAYARPLEPRRTRVEVGELLAGVADLVRGAYERRGIAVTVERGNGLTVEADAEQIRQVLLNLVRNGVESLGEGGKGGVTLRAAAGVDARARGRAEPVVLLEVADTGPGIPEAVQVRLFEPFFSTKPGGTGLGLAMARRIVGAHGGELRYRTQPGMGTTFTLVLPRTTHDDRTTPVGGR